MDCSRVAKLIRTIRSEKGLTQKQLANLLNISDKTISKWERGQGMPDVSLLGELSQVLDVNIDKILQGELTTNNIVGGNMKKSKYYVCTTCGNISICTGEAEVSCCCRRLEQQVAQKADDMHTINIEEVEDEWYLTTNHTMQKDHYIAFVAFINGDKLQICKQYPEWDFQTRLPKGHGIIFWYCTQHGLFRRII